VPAPKPERPKRRRASRPAAGKSARKPGPRRKRQERRSLLGKALLAALLLGLASGALFWLTLPSVEPLREGPPPVTALMETRAAEARAKGQKVRRAFVPVALHDVSPWLRHAVINSEDARFFLHHGFDLQETQNALQKALEKGELGRGASTLTQQLAKNLWLGEQRSLYRKAREAVLATRLEELGKERIFELYLNVVEWGEGVFGAEAAARTWFGVSAAQLAPEQAAVLAAMLPAPRKRNPRRPSGRLRKRAAQVLELYGVYRQLPPVELQAARGRLQALLGPEPRAPSKKPRVAEEPDEQSTR
jgi:monofunctional biosynthetic peptidoglycan transglycosylase